MGLLEHLNCWLDQVERCDLDLIRASGQSEHAVDAGGRAGEPVGVRLAERECSRRRPRERRKCP